MALHQIQSALPHALLSLAGETVQLLSTQAGCQPEVLSTASNAYQTPANIPVDALFLAVDIPNTITTKDAVNADQLDHWLRLRFDAAVDKKQFLQFEGLLTHADVFLNGVLILQSHNAFHTHIVDVTHQLKTNNQLYICFKAIAPLLAQKQPRARFPTRLINQRHLRFIRTPALGYMPGFASEAKLIGAFRPIKLITQTFFKVQSVQVNTVLIGDKTGKISARLSLKCLANIPKMGTLVLMDETNQTEIAHTPAHFNCVDNIAHFEGDIEATGIEAYWPHTHGMPKRYLLKLTLDSDNDALENNELEIVLGRYGFRSITRANANSLSLQINNTAVFLRGACWTPMNPLSLQTSPADLHQRLLLLKNAGMNMLRLPGNMPYECDDFYEMCDALGILIMQDFAFSNFDYPEDSAAFVASVQQETETFLRKHGHRACLTLLAGNSEVAQQAAMMGVDLDKIHNSIFDEILKNICAEHAPNVPYVSSSPNAKDIPFHAGNGTSHYYGVGGYRRSFDDARLFKGQFIAECLAFSHVPEDASLYQFFNNELLPAHHPRWKEGVPRDNGSGWDFSDITDFYVEQLFGINPTQLRITEPQRYLEICRATSCEVVERTMNILRANSAQGRAALVWYLHDLKAGAGWGYIDSLGVPKSAFYGLARASQPSTILFVDEGLEGLAVYLAHDGAAVLDCQLEIALITAEGKVFEQTSQPCQLTPSSLKRISVDAFLGRFVDSSYAYRFGARGFVATVAKLVTMTGELISQKVFVDPSLTLQAVHGVTISADAQQLTDSRYCLKLSASQPTFFVAIDAPGCTLSHHYFHLMPGYPVEVIMVADQQLKPHGRVRALNAQTAVIKVNDIKKP